MKFWPYVKPLNLRLLIALAALIGVGMAGAARASSYLVYIPLDDPIYEELDTLNNLGYLDTYLSEIKPISRLEAARLTLEAEHNLDDRPEPLAGEMVHELRMELSREVGWIEQNQQDHLPDIFDPAQRFEGQYVFSRGERRKWRTSQIGTPGDAALNAYEATPLLPYNNGLPTAPGSNEILRLAGWAGAWGFFTAYGEGALAGPLTRQIPGVSRLQPVSFAGVASLGNVSLSLGMEQMWWGVGHFGALSQSNNASPFPAIRLRMVHPIMLPWIFRYLGQFRAEGFFGQLDDHRYFYHPYIDGQIFAFKPLPTFEFGFTHAIMFGGQHNHNYSASGFIGRASGFATGSPAAGNTNSRGGVYLRFYFPHWRNLQVYQEIVGEDNLTKEIPGIGRTLPFLAVSYQGGFYLPRLTKDGRTDLRFEYAILEPNYSVHSDSLYWTYEQELMGYAMGPDATKVDLQLGRWVDLQHKADVDLFYTEQAPTYSDNTPYPPTFYPYTLGKEHSAGVAFSWLSLPAPVRGVVKGLAWLRARAAMEYVEDPNYQSGGGNLRLLVSIGGSFEPSFPGWVWH